MFYIISQEVVHYLLSCGARIPDSHSIAELSSMYPLSLAPVTGTLTSLEALHHTMPIYYPYTPHKEDRDVDVESLENIRERKISVAYSLATSITCNTHSHSTSTVHWVDGIASASSPPPSVLSVLGGGGGGGSASLMTVHATFMHYLLTLDRSTQLLALGRRESDENYESWPYAQRLHLVGVANTIYIYTLRRANSESLVSESTRYRTICELVALLFDRDMLSNLVNMRLVCKSSCYQRRFPVPSYDGVFLEANIVEDFAAYEVSRRLPTSVIMMALANTCW
jgi:hypothetical protein